MSETQLFSPMAGWLSMLDEVADPVFGQQMMGDGFAINPVAGELRAPADATVAHVATTGHAVTLRLGDGIELLLHIGLDTVTLGGAGFRPKVTEGQAVRAGDLLIAFDLDAVGRAAKDLVTPVVAPDVTVKVRVDRPGRLVAIGDPIAWVTTGATNHCAAASGPETRRRIIIAAPDGLHARPAARVVALLKPFAAVVELRRGKRVADARSTVALLALGARQGDVLEAQANGVDAEAALEALDRFATERFGDPLRPAATPAVACQPGGVCAAPGLAIGRVMQLRLEAVEVDADSAGITAETMALEVALRAVAAALGVGDLADAHRAILDDPTLRKRAQAAIETGGSAGIGWRSAVREAVAALEETGDARLAERVADLLDLERQVLLALSGREAVMPLLPPDTILVADDLLPSQFMALDLERLAGICTAAGGPTAHVAILAAGAAVPMVVAAGRAVLDLADDTIAILDAEAARLVVDPDADALAEASARIAARHTARAAALRDAATPAATADGHRIEVFANLGSVEDAAAAVRAGAEGCGLVRTEFLFLDREAAPGEAEQRALYATIAATLGDRPVIFRTLDIGGDKPVPYLPRTVEANPALGQRGIRLSLARPDLLGAQLRAIVAAVPGAQCRIMLPMVADVAELIAVRAMLDAAMAAVGRVEPVALGVMIETPAAALIADRLAEYADFLSVGTNDLTQYALAADRGNASVSAMLDALHPAVLRLLRLAVDGAVLHGRSLGVCGGLASDPRATALLIGLGVTELSAVPAAVPAVKAAVRATMMADAVALAEKALAARSTAEVRTLVKEAA